MGFLDSLFGGNTQPQTMTQTTTARPSVEQQKIMNLAMPGVESFASKPIQRYQGQTIADFTPDQLAAMAMGRDAATGAQTGLATAGANTAQGWLGGDVWNPQTNAMLQGAIDAASRPVNRQLMEEWLPSIRGEAATTGNFGSSRQGIAEGQAVGRTAQTVADQARTMANDLYRTNVDAQMKALGLLPTVQGAQLAPAQTMAGIGEANQAMEQLRLQEAAGNFNFDQYAPFLQSKELLSLVSGLPGGSNTTTGNVLQPPQPSTANKLLGGATAGASLGSMFGPIGTGIGALGGGLLSLFG